MATVVVFATAGQAHLVDYLDTQTWYAGIGTGGTGAVIGDTALTTEVETRDETTDTQPASNQLQAVGSISITGTHALDEAGLFTASSGGTMYLSATFDVNNVENGDTFEPTFQLTLQDSSE